MFRLKLAMHYDTFCCKHSVVGDFRYVLVTVCDLELDLDTSLIKLHHGSPHAENRVSHER